MRVATIDIGTNTVLLLIAERQAESRVVPVVERATITRLGEGVDRARKLADAAVERTLACLEAYAREIAATGVDALDVLGTSALRDADHDGRFVERARSILGVAPRVIPGEEEASLAFRGGLSALQVEDGEVTLFDVGGGSTELVTGSVRARIATVVRRHSLDMGSVRFTERFFASDPPSAEALAQAAAAAEALLATVPAPGRDARLIGTAGTVTTLAAVAHGVAPYDAHRIHGLRLTSVEIDETTSRLAAVPLAARRTVPGLEPKRADVIVAGAVIVEAVLRWARAREIIVSDRGVRWGAALRLLEANP